MSTVRGPVKEDVFGTGISVTTLAETMVLFDSRNPERALTVNACNVHSVMSARSDRDLAQALAESDINTSDGVPLVWVLRTRGFRDHARMYGPDLAEYAFEHGLSRGWRHFFYGATRETLDQLEKNLRAKYPDMLIAGTHAPPFRPETAEERAHVLQAIRESAADMVWVGLGMPKQEKWMFEVRNELPGKVLVGIGAAFDFFAGTKPQAPLWMQRRGLEWMFRLGTEPRRLWRRYAWNNPAFLLLWLREMTIGR